MAQVLVRNLPDEVHRALRVRATANNRSTEAEVCSILSMTVLPQQRQPDGQIKLGTFLSKGRAKLTDEEFAIFGSVRERTPARALQSLP
jgi:plasmid stability protein